MRRIIFTLLCLILAANAAAAQREMSVTRPWGTMHGTLYTPDTGSEVVAIIIAGSGPTDRNGNSGGLMTNTYYKLASALAERGIATLCYDKQGIGASRFDDPAAHPESSVRFDDFIDDARAWIGPLRAKGFSRVILAGHSEGALIALCLAADDPTAADGVISLCGAGYPMDQILQMQLGRDLIGYNPGLLLKSNALLARLKRGESIPEEEIPTLLRPLFRPSVQPFLISQMTIDPREKAARVTVPLLILGGDNDIQVTADNARALHTAQPAARLVVVPGMTHLLTVSEVRDVQQQKLTVYMDAAAPLAEEAIDAIETFIFADSTKKD